MDENKEGIVWWKDAKLLTGVILVVLSFVLGFYGKLLFILKFYEPIYVITGLSIFAFSWIVLFLGVFLVGWETVKMIQVYIQQRIEKTAKETYRITKEFPKKSYHYTKELPKKSYRYTKELHKRGINKIATTSKNIVEKIMH